MNLPKWVRQVVTSISIVVLVAACWRFEEPSGGPVVRNDLTPNIEVFLIGEDGSENSLPVPLTQSMSLGISHWVSEGCTTKVLIARFEDGTEVERRDPGLSEAELWIVNGDPSD